MKVLISADQIAERNAALAIEIAQALPESVRQEGVVMVGPLKGAVVFLVDLARELGKHVQNIEMDFLGLSSYGGGTVSKGEVTMDSDLRHDVADKHVLLVDDIVDTGRTLAFAHKHLAAKGPASLRTVTLLDKPSRRVIEVPVEHVGFTIEDVFVVGYGTDYAEKYREVPFIGILRD